MHSARAVTMAQRPKKLQSAAAIRLGRHGFTDWLVWFYFLTILVPKPVSVAVGPLDITPLQVSALLVSLMIMFEMRFRLLWPDYLVGLIFAQRLIVLMVTGAVGMAVQTVLREFLELGVAYLVGRYIAMDHARFWRHMRLFTSVMLFMALIGLYEAVTFVNPHEVIWRVDDERRMGLNAVRLGLLRARGWTNQPMMFGLSYLIFLPIVVYAFFTDRRLLGRLSRVKALGILLGLFCSISSGPWLGAMVLFGLLLLNRVTRAWSDRKWGVIVFVLLGFYAFLEAASNRAILSFFMMRLHISSPDSAYYRWKLYRRVLSVMPGHWWMGWGLRVPAEFSGPQTWSIDNYFLTVLLRYGLIGLVLWLAFTLAVLLYQRHKVWTGYTSGQLTIGRSLRFAVVAVSIVGLSADLFSTGGIFVYMLWGMALGAAFMTATESSQTSKLGSARLSRKRSRNITQANLPDV